ncbi:MAG: hypothetical protein OEY52_05595 [Gammaproteobacteria bacterium]|nr:hypothetical protein [Gammaproteobacteria bacterium]
MSYLLFALIGTIVFATLFHVRKQFLQTAHIRQSLNQARASQTLTGMHKLRKDT